MTNLAELGYAVRPFQDPTSLGLLVDLCRSSLSQLGLHGDLADYHTMVTDQEFHVRAARAATDAVLSADLVERLFRPEEEFLCRLLGPDLVIQSAPHLRVGRPDEERDSIGLHRDSFYGSSIWHLNCWFPLVSLGPGSGLFLAPRTHVVPSRDVRDYSFPDAFRSQIGKGTTSHSLGFVYRPRIDETIASLTRDQLTLVSPPLGSYVIFFGCMVHGGMNSSDMTRWTIDVRFSKPEDGATTRSGFFRPFTQGLISRVAEKFYAA